jgi:hypothetical protein
MTIGRLRTVGHHALLIVIAGLASPWAVSAFAQGLRPPSAPAAPGPATPSVADAAPSEPAALAPASPAAKRAPLPAAIIKASIAPQLKMPSKLPALAPAPSLTAAKANLAGDDTGAHAEPSVDPSEQAVVEASQQLDKFQKVFEQATKIFGSEHTIITPSFFLATDIKGRLNPTEKHMAGLSAVLLLPLVGAGGGHGLDWWPVVTTEDATQIYKDFLGELKKYEEVTKNATTLPDDVRTVLNAKWDAQRLAAAAQLFCQEDIDWPASLKDKIAALCGGKAGDADIANLVTAAPTSEIAPRRHNLLLGPSLGIPLTKNPVDLFQVGGALEFGGESVRLVLTGGFVGRYQGATYRDIFAAGWFVGLALSGEIGDKLFHYFNGGSDLMAQLARVKTSQ